LPAPDPALLRFASRIPVLANSAGRTAPDGFFVSRQPERSKISAFAETSPKNVHMRVPGCGRVDTARHPRPCGYRRRPSECARGWRRARIVAGLTHTSPCPGSPGQVGRRRHCGRRVITHRATAPHLPCRGRRSRRLCAADLLVQSLVGRMRRGRCAPPRAWPPGITERRVGTLHRSCRGDLRPDRSPVDLCGDLLQRGRVAGVRA
jgi:hypothetical protein